MARTLMMDYVKCHGCRICEAACSTMSQMKDGSSQPRLASVTWDLEGRGVSIICQHCQDAPCMDVCPRDAMSRDEELNRIMVDHDRCIGCRMCMAACPFGAMGFDGENGKIIKCDLCDGDPLCVELCPYEALQYVDTDEQCVTKSTEVAERLREIILGGKART